MERQDGAAVYGPAAEVVTERALNHGADIHESSRRLDRLSTGLLVAFAVVIIAVMLIFRVNASPDFAVVVAGVIAVLIGRGVSFVRDWAPFLAIFMAWELMRGIADHFGGTVRSDEVIAIERAIAFGTVPTVELQHRLWSGVPQLHDILLSFIYVAHFALPVGVAFALWLYRRSSFYPFVVALLVVSYASFVTFVVVPVAPPRFAGAFGQESLPVVDIVANVGQAFGWEGFIWSYRSLVGNPVAAFPSMHAAYPLLACLFLWPIWRAAGIGMAIYTAVVWFAIVYLGHHYVVDVLGGAAYAVIGYLAIRRFWRIGAPVPSGPVLDPE